jgi:hypothetical protein
MPAPNPVAIFAPPLNQLGVRWMAVGSIASSAYGEYRVTNDIDVILVLHRADAAAVAAAFPLEEFYCPPVEVIKIEASRTRRGHFNLIHHETGFKADVYLATHEPFQLWAYAHRRELQIVGTTAWIAPPEYVIIGKLEFFREGGSEKHLRDIRSMLAVTDVDRALVEQEARGRGLADCWQQCL